MVITDGRFDPRDDDSLLTYLCDDPSVDVNAIGVGDMFGREGQHESLESIACQRHDRVTGMTRFADLVADNFIDRMESVLCPGETIININASPKARDGVLIKTCQYWPPEWRSGLRHCVAMLEASLQTQVRSQGVTGSPIRRHAIGQALSRLG